MIISESRLDGNKMQFLFRSEVPKLFGSRNLFLILRFSRNLNFIFSCKFHVIFSESMIFKFKTFSRNLKFFSRRFFLPRNPVWEPLV
jgi:hypothetical protein